MRWGKRTLALLLCICLVISAYLPLSATETQAATAVKTVTDNGNEPLIYSFLTEEMGLNSAAACGILANVYRECRFNEKAEGANGLSYGICQWYNGNYERLVTYCEDNGYDYRTLAAQLYFLRYDLKSRFGKLLNMLLSAPDTAEGAYQAAYDFCYNYERPKNYQNASESRGELSRDTFWPVYQGVRLIVPLDSATHEHSYTTVVTKATLSSDGTVKKVCSLCNRVQSTQVIKKVSSITLSDASFVYNGKTRKPTVKVKDSTGKTLSSSNYTVSYPKTCKNVGIYKVTVTLKGNYSGKKTMTYQIVPKTTSLKSVTGKKKSLYLKWNKNTTQTTGYQIQYTTQTSFKGANAPTITLKNKTTAQTIKKLTAKKRYYVRVRTYKSLQYNGKTVKVYSAWSPIKNAVTKA